jgi:hypothetical protein
LDILGYRVLTATNADDALNVIRGKDVIPGGMNGVQLTVEERRGGPRSTYS